ncbi:MAG: PEP-CTERM sorting domain-containing protein [Sedimentisphaerales bacterium]|nr:PEP-CTERM sorting domain-containing protein [Sedimentisphaerales bacterium]MBN2843427.1 PEP-CTERM sorting domain-containing protein [Sedimentisphaerales bacterium]
MKKLLLVSSLLCLVAGAQANLIVNPGFESVTGEGTSASPYMPTDWTAYKPSTATAVYFAAKNTPVYAGDYSMKIAARNSYGMIHQTVSVVAGSELNLSFQALGDTNANWMIDEPGDLVDVSLKFMDGQGVEISQPSFVAFDGDEETATPVLSATTWQLFSQDFIVPENAQSLMVKIRAIDGSQDGGTIDGTAVYLDAVSLTVVPEPVTLVSLALGAVGVLRRRNTGK